MPAALLILVLLGLIAGTGYLVSWIELRSAGAHEMGIHAYHVAEAGLAEAMAVPGFPPATGRTVTLGGESAQVSYGRLLAFAGGGALYDVRSTGTHGARGHQIARTVARVVWAAGPPTLDAAVTLSAFSSLGVFAGGASGYITGNPPSGCARPAGPGIATGGPVATGGISVTGVPPIWHPPPGSTTGMRTGLRWPDVIGPAIGAPDAVIPGAPWPAAGSGWMHVRLTAPGPLGPGHSGQGVIVATGDLQLANGFSWRGLLLAGGSIRLFGDAQISGALVAGLAGSPSTIDLGDGHVAITFDPCAADLAADRLEPFPAGLPGTWREEW